MMINGRSPVWHARRKKLLHMFNRWTNNHIETLTFAPHSVRKCREKAVDVVFLSDFNKISCIFAYKILLQKQIYSFFC